MCVMCTTDDRVPEKLSETHYMLLNFGHLFILEAEVTKDTKAAWKHVISAVPVSWSVNICMY